MRDNLKKIPSPLLKIDHNSGFKPYLIAYDYVNYDPDVEEIKQKTYKLLGISASFYVKTYPSDNIDGNRLKEILKQVRNWCIEVKETHKIKSSWYMIVFLLEDKGYGLNKKDMLDLLSKNEPSHQVPEDLRKVYGNFGYRYTLSRSFDEVIDILIKNKWIQKDRNKKYRLLPEGIEILKTMVDEGEKDHLNIAAYGKLRRFELLKRIGESLAK